MTERRFITFGQPHGKGRPRMTRSGRVYTDSKTRSYEKTVKGAYLHKYNGEDVLRGSVAVKISAYYKIPKTRPHAEGERCTTTPDADNVAKSVLDALNGIAWDDDKRVSCLLVNKYYSQRPRVEVTLKEINSDE